MLWWPLVSRAPRAERWGGLALMIAALAATWALAHPSISTGAMGMLVPLLAVPVLGFAFGIWAWASRSLSGAARPASMAATIVLACGVWTLVRTDGMTSSCDRLGLPLALDPDRRGAAAGQHRRHALRRRARRGDVGTNDGARRGRAGRSGRRRASTRLRS